MGGSVLVVEDEFLIRAAVVDCLSEAGHAVIEAANASSALDALNASDVDVAVVDIRLPGHMDGLALAEWIGAHRPRVQIILASGDLNAAVRRAGAKAALWFLEKPFAAAALQAMIEAALTDRSAFAPSQQGIPPPADSPRGCSL
jgi:DNA-binding NtrC family response regulator